MNYECERRVAIEAVIKACRLCEAIRAGELSGEIMEKQDKSPVTVADFSTQAEISLDLLGAFPDDSIMAEENLAGVPMDLKEKVVEYVSTISPSLTNEQIFFAIDRCNCHGGPTGRFWVLDPIDGTKGFLRGDQYAVALALVEDGEVVLGVLGCPNLPQDLKQLNSSRGSVFIATKNQGSAIRLIDNPSEQMIKVADIADPRMASFCESFETTSTSHRKSARIAETLGLKKPSIRIDSQCKYGLVARGDVSIYLRVPNNSGYEEKIWDHAAGWLIVNEAGGEVTDIYGRPLDFSIGQTLSHNTGIVATNGKLHSKVISGIQQASEGN